MQTVGKTYGYVGPDANRQKQRPVVPQLRSGKIKHEALGMFGLELRYKLSLGICAIFATLIAAPFCGAQGATDNEPITEMMRSTFLISGPQTGHPNRTSFGTVFIIGTSSKTDPSTLYYTLVTAAHVLNDIEGDFADLVLRKRRSDGTYEPFEHRVQIRRKGEPLFVQHPTADVVSMYVVLPDPRLALVPKSFLADDSRVKELELHPGDEAFCLGFPLAASVNGVFPVLRTGRIASYPLLPSTAVKQWMFDLFLYPGNSGGPVFINGSTRGTNGGIAFGSFFAILGLVIQQSTSALPEFADKPLNLGVIVPAHFILETLDKLPAQP